MIYVDRDKLTVIEQNGELDRVSFDELAHIIFEKPSNMIYCISKGELCGIISMGDIARAKKSGTKYVMINKKFTRVLKHEYIKAREIFLCQENKNIHVLPVVDEDNVLLGAYTRWDDLKISNYFFRGGVFCWYRQHYNGVFLVYPCTAFKEKRTVFETFRAYLISEGIHVNCIKHSEIINFCEKVNWMLFVDEDEIRAMDTLHKYIWNKELKNCYTYNKFIEVCCYETEGILRNIKGNGVNVFCPTWEYNAYNSWYAEKLEMEIADKYMAFGDRVNSRLNISMYQGFFDDIYSEEYANDIVNLKCPIETESGCGKLKNCHSKLYNVSAGERYTSGQPGNYNRTIYFVGPCYIYGRFSEDSNTIESFMQERINNAGYKIKVVNCGSPAYRGKRGMDLVLARILTLPLKKGDIVVYGYRHFWDIDKINLMDACFKHNVKAEWMVDSPRHCNHRLNSIYADTIFDALKPVLQEETEGQGVSLERNCDFIKTLYIDRYFKNYKFSEYHKAGAIVMNCNPFTCGHRYLIEQALETVDFLIIFVVEEDSSLFSFNERFAMVCEGTADLNNVMVVPSGPFILSQTTFPEYFIKAEDENLDENTENDVKLFAQKIAGYLNIRYRFAGEEPEDMVTNKYNMYMKKILPENGIKFVEIPRKKVDGQYISASLVRQCLESYDLKGLSKLVPDSTMRLLSVPDIEEMMKEAP